MASVALLPVVALVAGAACGIAFQSQWRLLWLLPILVAAAWLAWRFRYPRATLAALVCACGCSGFVLGAHARDAAIDTPLRRSVGNNLGGPIVARLLLTEDADSDATFTILRGRVTAVREGSNWTPSDGGVVVSVGGVAGRTRAGEWRRGRLLEAPIAFRRPARYLNEGVADFEREAALDGVTLLGSIKSGLLVQVIRRGSIASETGAAVRMYVRRAVSRRIAPHGDLSAAIVSAVLIGDRSGLPDDIRLRLQAAGTYHVIAISGGNIAILTGLLIVSLVPLGLSGRRGAFATLLLLFAYAEIVTAGPSVWRATLVAAVYLVARLLDHRSAPWQAMAVAAGLLVVIAPLDVTNAGFVLTFGATAALLGVMHRRFARPRWLSWLVTSIVASAAVEIALLPVMAATFSRITLAGLVLNLVAVPAMALVQVAGLVAVCANAFDGIASAAGWLAHLGAFAIVESARLVDAAPWLALRVPAPPPPVIAAYYAGLTLFLWRRAPWMRVVGLASVIAASALIVTGVRRNVDVHGLRLTMVDVGQGDGMVLQVPGGHALMVDSGGSPFGGGGFDIGTRVVEPALWARGIRTLDALLLTHGDPDHIGGAAPLIDDFSPTSMWQGIPVARAVSLQALLAHAAASSVNIVERREGEALRIGSARVLVLHPPAPDWERQRVRNDDSVVLEVLYGDVALLLTGDIGSDVERAIVPHLVPAKTRILKVAHHGSRTSTSQELLDAWRPQIALISCGRGNPFGHPAPEVVSRLAAAGARIYRTDRDGEITVDTDGERVVVRTFAGEKP
ncbi:MAG TPA: DNA internalization-related competence protein ComEC/Rec2 [Vicinamibacterales bacterium]|nr:DNA internalization-related competence protein ComEC/Rec2 [Vicinamibacterales bacterium]